MNTQEHAREIGAGTRSDFEKYQGGDTDPTAVLEYELECLWGDLSYAIRMAHNGVWSIGCEALCRRIVNISLIVGATNWEKITVQLLHSRVYSNLMEGAQIEFDPVDYDVVNSMTSRR